MSLTGRGRAGFIRVAAVAALVGAGAAHAQPASTQPRLTPEQAANIFGLREHVLNASLSPDGTKFAEVVSEGARGAVLRILDLADPQAMPKPILASTGNPERLAWCRWAGNSRLMCSGYASTVLDTGDVTYVTRMIAIDPNGENQQVVHAPRRTGRALGYTTFGGAVLDWNTGRDGHVLMVRRYIPEFSTGTRNAQTADGLGVDELNSANLAAKPVERARPTAVEYISDGQGRVRIMGLDAGLSRGGYLSPVITYQYRARSSDNWLPLGTYERTTGEGFNPYHVDPALDVAYGLRKLDGRLAAYSRALDGTGRETLQLAHPAVDIDGFVTLGRNRRVIGITYTTDRQEVEYIDPGMKKLAAALGRALPGLPLIRIVDSSQDERKLLIWAGSDVDPGRYYVLDRDSNGMEEITVSRRFMDQVALAQVRHVTYPARDGTAIPAYLTIPAGSDGRKLPAIVLPHGGPSARDSWGFDWLVQFWASLGYAVLQPNFRGSAGYGDAWFQMNGFQSWRTAIGDVVDGGRWLVGEGIADPDRLAVLGWSYGGYAALQSAVEEPDLFRAVVAIAPVTDLARLKEESAGFTNYRLSRDFIGSGPHIEEGSPARQAARIKVPVLMFHGTHDENVSVRQARTMADRLKSAGKSVDLVVFERLDHYLEDSRARRDMLLRSADFLRAAFGEP